MLFGLVMDMGYRLARPCSQGRSFPTPGGRALSQVISFKAGRKSWLKSHLINSRPEELGSKSSHSQRRKELGFKVISFTPDGKSLP